MYLYRASNAKTSKNTNVPSVALDAGAIRIEQLLGCRVICDLGSGQSGKEYLVCLAETQAFSMASRILTVQVGVAVPQTRSVCPFDFVDWGEGRKAQDPSRIQPLPFPCAEIHWSGLRTSFGGLWSPKSCPVENDEEFARRFADLSDVGHIHTLD